MTALATASEIRVINYNPATLTIIADGVEIIATQSDIEAAIDARGNSLTPQVIELRTALCAWLGAAGK